MVKFGIHAGFRFLCLTACGFESRLAHQFIYTMYHYQQYGQFLGQVADGLEYLGREELSELGAEKLQDTYRGVFFNADLNTLYRINYCSRIFTRFLAPLLSFSCHSTKYLYRRAQDIDWSEFLTNDQTFAVTANVANSPIKHSGYAALCLKDAIVDQFRTASGRRPSIDTEQPDLRVHLYIQGDKAVISIDTAGGSLHKRGYRQQTVEAPMQETLAATIIKKTGWNGDRPLYDPFCGSGTLLCEALMHYCRIPAGIFRAHFGFEKLPDFDNVQWQDVKREADQQIRNMPDGLVAGSDKSDMAVQASRANLALFKAYANVDIERTVFEKIPPKKDCTIVCNPPYGIRMGNPDDVKRMLKQFGDYLKQQCRNSSAHIYFGDPDLIPAIALRSKYKIAMTNGGLKGRLCRFDMY